MGEIKVFYPAKKRGVIFHLANIIIFTAGGVVGLAQAARSPAGLIFLLYLFFALFSVGLVLVLAYRLYSLWTASYSLERDGIHIRWGLRAEDVPIDAIRWVRPAENLQARLPLPFFRWPGAVRGERHFHMESGMQRIEYMADRASQLVLIAAAGTLLAVSPADRDAFLAAYQEFNEMGSLTPLPAQSVHPAFLFPEMWKDVFARFLVVGSILLVVILFAWVSLIIPGRQPISLRISPSDTVVEYVPAAQLLLLPVMNGVFFLVDLSLGLFFFRRAEIRSLAYLMWGSSMVVSLLFIGAAIFILRAS